MNYRLRATEWAEIAGALACAGIFLWGLVDLAFMVLS